LKYNPYENTQFKSTLLGKDFMAKTSNLGHHFAKDLQIFVPGDKDFFEDDIPGKKCSSALATTEPMYKVFGKS